MTKCHIEPIAPEAIGFQVLRGESEPNAPEAIEGESIGKIVRDDSTGQLSIQTLVADDEEHEFVVRFSFNDPTTSKRANQTYVFRLKKDVDAPPKKK